MSERAGTLDPATTTGDVGARVPRVPPPLYYAVGFAAGMLVNRVIPLPVDGRPATAIIGAGVLGAGVALAAAGVASVVRRRTTIVPHHVVSALVTTGAYRLSRNPMYAGLAIASVGGALLAGSWWPLIMLPLVLFAVLRWVIYPEERYLAGRFGQRYADYRARVRRWL